VVVAPFAFHIAVLQLFKPFRPRMLPHDYEPSLASFSLCFKSLLMLLLLASQEFVLEFPSPRHPSVVPASLICVAWETLLVAVFLLAYLSGLLELPSPSTVARWIYHSRGHGIVV
jgi:hypothetical protein